jgi:putative DNA primase/helicase
VNPADLIEKAFADGVGVILDGNQIALDGPSKAVEKWSPRFRQHEKQVVQHLREIDCVEQAEYRPWLSDEQRRQENELAKQFIDAYCHSLRFVPKWNRWLCWDGKRWLRDDSGIGVLEAARQFAESLWVQFGEAARFIHRDDIGCVQTFVRRCNNALMLRDVIHLARTDRRIVVSHEDLNQEVGILNCENGILDLATGVLSPHEPARNITQLASVEYHDTDCPQFKQCLNLIFDGDAELIRYVRALIGYAVSGNCSAHILPIAYGSGCNGKSTLTNIILALLGDYGALANESLLLGNKNQHPAEKVHLYQKRFVPISEPDAGSQLKESRVKELTGDAVVTARGMGENFWSFRRTFTFWMSTNFLPSISGSDEGLWRRIRLIPFQVDLRTKTNPEADLDKRLIREEGPGILRWLVDGYQDYLANGFIEPVSVLVATNGYRTDEDELGRFIQERCYVSPNGIATADELWQAYQQFRGSMNRTNFGREMGNRFTKETPSSGAYRRKTIYRGIALLSSSQSLTDEPYQSEFL